MHLASTPALVDLSWGGEDHGSAPYDHILVGC